MSLETPTQLDPAAADASQSDASASAAAIEVADLSHAYTRAEPKKSRRKRHPRPAPAYQLDPALSGISFRVEPGEIFGFLGPNGSGKSTLFRILATVQAQQPPTGEKPGKASIFGTDIAENPDTIRQNLGVVFQHAGLDDKLTARENLRFHGMLYGIGKTELNTACGRWLETLGLADRSDDLIESFSGGMKRRIEIAKALMPEPRLLMMDEASTGLDAAVLRDIWDLLQERVDDDGLTIALTTHLMHEAERCDRLALLSQGKLVAIDTPSGLVGRIGGQVLEVQLTEDATCDPHKTRGELEHAISNCISSDSPEQAPPIQWLGSTARVEHDAVAHWVQPILDAMGSQIRGIRVGQPTLEDAYLKLTGHRLGENPDAA